ncbi:ribosome small subunit-dependent GTPase A [Rhodococcus sp. AD45-ID]|uniref:ribosome small subunit-dependent GTPase A n=1 Tax=unclassified Rhodococcus (in: high G+C Gram-positive bacteria) TaxID=192944 RepID=UPI0005D451E6|nr:MULTISPECIES: ribosome small subunit-dependent GTPase A [unclassified Rhodococcus (in: high G+C Gram-positive bacteria)]KJF25146.1 putative ribosome biogenesis GTPase RsgA [Rhodococcus sp. AD45]PSR43919.1 ribosome small subunit-dependent GTPase A [Rhodococcus sp. AD45-ID]
MPENSTLLTEYGWNATLSETFDALLVNSPDTEPGRVIRVDRGQCDVAVATGTVRALSGSTSLCTGDWVAVSKVTRANTALATTGETETPTVTSIFPRSSSIVRSAASGKSEGQILAANVDTVVITTASDGDVDLGRIERLLALAWESGATPVVALTKTDAAPDISAVLAEVSAVAPGATVLAVSAETSEGMDILDAVLDGTVAILGPSGAGKSTLANALLGDTAASCVLETGRVRAGDGKGRHTTVTRELIPFSGGRTLIDTPGLRGVGMWNAGEGIDKTFPEIEELISACRFSDCAHNSEPGCAVVGALERGDIDERRLRSYRKLQRENAWNAARSDARLQAERTREIKVLSRRIKDHYRGRRQ